MQASIDHLTPEKHLIDLSSHSDGDFGLEDYKLSFVFDDIVVVEYIDITDDGNAIKRGAIYVPTNALTKAWRKGVVVLTGPEAKYTSKGDIVIFPNNLGATVSNIDIEGYGKLKKGIFLNEKRMFGKCKVLKQVENTEENDNSTTGT